MKKLKIDSQASKCEWWETPLGTFHVEIVAKSSETAQNCRKYLPWMSKFLLMGFDGKKQPKQKAKTPTTEVK